MNTAQTNIETLRDIRSMMERSSRFISLSGWSGIAAGVCALAGAWLAYTRIDEYYDTYNAKSSCASCLRNDLLFIAAGVFVLAFIAAMLFTFLRSKKEQVPIWGVAARRLLWNTLLPMLVGGVVIWRMIELRQFEFVAPLTLIFYGLALVNGSKYTMGEIRYLGYAEILTGIAAMFIFQRGLYFWAFGFGVLHIVYGISMWWKYERPAARQN